LDRERRRKGKKTPTIKEKTKEVVRKKKGDKG
jgi:hypothetical protein